MPQHPTNGGRDVPGPIPILGQTRMPPPGSRARLTLPSGVAIDGPAELLMPLQAMIEGLRELQVATFELAKAVRGLDRRVDALAKRVGRGG
jgi:hypothetical protein